MTGPISEYLGEKGSIEILATIEPDGTRFKELKQTVGVSHGTISTRLAQGDELGLLEREAMQGERGTTHKWVLAPKGAVLRHRLQITGVVKTYELLQDLRQQVEAHNEEFKEWVQEMEANGELDDEQRNDSIHHKWRKEFGIYEDRTTDEE